MQNLVSCHFASQVESGMEEHWEWENLGRKKKNRWLNKKLLLWFYIR